MIEPYYQADGITIYHGDCRDVLRELGRFDLLLTDPPYGIGSSRDVVRHGHGSLGWDARPPSTRELAALVQGSVKSIVWGGNYFSLPPSRMFLIWDKQQPEDFSVAMAEQAWCSWDENAKLFRFRAANVNKMHPTQKPLPLIRWCLSLVPAAKTVLDPFLGSGTTAVACKLAGIECVGIEQEERYCESAVNRLRQGVFQFA